MCFDITMCKNVGVTLIRRYQGIISQPSLSNQDQLLRPPPALTHLTLLKTTSINGRPFYLLPRPTNWTFFFLGEMPGIFLSEFVCKQDRWYGRSQVFTMLVLSVLSSSIPPNMESRGPNSSLQIDFKRMQW